MASGCRYDRKLLGRMTREAWLCVRACMQEVLGRKDVVPGMVAGLQTHGELVNYHPHIHALVTCGAFTEDGSFLETPGFDEERMLALWENRIFKLLRKEERITEEVVDEMRSASGSAPFGLWCSLRCAPRDLRPSMASGCAPGSIRASGLTNRCT